MGLLFIVTFDILLFKLGVAVADEMFILDISIVFDVRLRVIFIVGFFLLFSTPSLFKVQNDWTLFLKATVFGLLFFDGSLNLNYFKIYFEKEIELFFLGDTKESPLTWFLIGGASWI